MPEQVTRFWEMFLESTSHMTAAELILRSALIGCSFFAAVQFLSMWATHYGDRNATSKAFFLSLLLHCCFGLGWATVTESMPRSPLPEAQSVESPVNVTLTTDEEYSPSPGNSPAMWKLSPAGSQISRMQVEQTEAQVDNPEITRAPMRLPMPMADLPSRMEEPEVVPVPQSVASAAAAPARLPTDIDQIVREARPEFSPSAARRQIRQEMSAVESPGRVEPQRGAAERVSPTLDEGAALKFPTEMAENAEVPKPVGAPEEFIRRRSSPGPIPNDASQTGDQPSSSANTATGNRKNGRFTRAGSPMATDSNPEPAPIASARPSAPSVPMEQRVISSRPSMGTTAPSPVPRPELAKIESGPTFSRPHETRDPEIYRSRQLEQRKEIALKNGGSEDSERAVEMSLRWLASAQEPAGYWSAAKYGGGTDKKDPQGNNRLDGGLYADTGLTGLVVLSFLGAGYTHEEGKYADVVSRALQWLMTQQTANGYLGGRSTKYDMMYCHSMATFALAEACGMQNDPSSMPELRDAVRRGVRLICANQNDDGGWRYSKGVDSDMSMFGWQLMALKSAVHAGIPVPEETRIGMSKFLQARARGTHGGLAGYKATDPPTPAMTAEALFCRQMFGGRPHDAAAQESVLYLRRNLPRLSAYDEYYWYYGTLAMYQYDGAAWEEWNGALRDSLIRVQRKQGSMAGSWDPNGKWAGIGGRLYSTALSTMCLEVYYRFLRIYQLPEGRQDPMPN